MLPGRISIKQAGKSVGLFSFLSSSPPHRPPLTPAMPGSALGAALVLSPVGEAARRAGWSPVWTLSYQQADI